MTRSAREFVLAHYNRARAKGDLDSRQMAGFVIARDPIYQISDRLPGFIWRHDQAESICPFEDKRIVVGLSTWKDVASLKGFVYGNEHAELLRRRATWFESHSGANHVLWWHRADQLPTVADGEERLAYITEYGPTEHAFNFQRSFPQPQILIGTLGPRGTNSEKAAREFIQKRGMKSIDLRLFDTFEEVADRLIDGSLDKGIICTAYLKYSAVYFERVPALRIVEAFVADLHPMVIATRPGFQLDDAETFAAQPAILPLIRTRIVGKHVPAASNSSAAEDVALEKVDACLTTEVASNAWKLSIRDRMPPLHMTFALFERSRQRSLREHHGETLASGNYHFPQPTS